VDHGVAADDRPVERRALRARSAGGSAWPLVEAKRAAIGRPDSTDLPVRRHTQDEQAGRPVATIDTCRAKQAAADRAGQLAIEVVTSRHGHALLPEFEAHPAPTPAPTEAVGGNQRFLRAIADDLAELEERLRPATAPSMILTACSKLAPSDEPGPPMLTGTAPWANVR
jgi:hypothetical protein